MLNVTPWHSVVKSTPNKILINNENQRNGPFNDNHFNIKYISCYIAISGADECNEL